MTRRPDPAQRSLWDDPPAPPAPVERLADVIPLHPHATASAATTPDVVIMDRERIERLCDEAEALAARCRNQQAELDLLRARAGRAGQ